MNPAFTSRRRADDFDRLVEAAVQGTTAPGPVSTELTALADLAVGLRELAPVAPRASFSADLRERLMAAAATELTPATARTTERLTVRRAEPSRRRTERRLTVGVAALAIIGGTAGTALASQSALPGQSLYPVKRAIENVKAGFSIGDDAKGSTLLSDANTRLEEVSKLSRSSSSAKDQEEISKTLTTFADQAQKASDLLLSDYQSDHDAASIQKLHDFTAASIDQLTELQPVLPEQAENALSAAAQALLMIDSAARNLCPMCGNGGVTSLPTTLLDPVAKTLDGLGKALSPKKSTTPAGTPTALPSVPTNIGPANSNPLPKAPKSAPSSPHASAKPTGKSLPKLPSAPTATPTDLGQVVGGVVQGVGGTVGGVLGTVGGVLGGVSGLLGGSTQAPNP